MSYNTPSTSPAWPPLEKDMVINGIKIRPLASEQDLRDELNKGLSHEELMADIHKGLRSFDQRPEREDGKIFSIQVDVLDPFPAEPKSDAPAFEG